MHCEDNRNIETYNVEGSRLFFTYLSAIITKMILLLFLDPRITLLIDELKYQTVQDQYLMSNKIEDNEIKTHNNTNDNTKNKVINVRLHTFHAYFI